MILPLAFIAGHVRGIPFYWQIIDVVSVFLV